MSSKHKRTKACEISKKTKLIVYERDGRCCIFCGKIGLPEAHVIPRSHGGLGCPENIITVCRTCHDKLDNSTERKKMLFFAIKYLKRFYPDWKKENFIFDKYRKDKVKKSVGFGKTAKIVIIDELVTEKTLKDKGEPPDGFRFL
mgnify:FL=1